MTTVTYQSNAPATPPSGTAIKVTDNSGLVQHVNVESLPAVTGEVTVSGSVAQAGAWEVSPAAGMHLDAFSRQRVSNTDTRMDAQFTYDVNPNLFDTIFVSGGSASHDANLRAVYLTTGGSASGAASTLRQHYYNPYTPGNSQLVILTGTLNPDSRTFASSVAEIGYGDAANAVGFRFTSGSASVFLRSSISGSAADLTTVAQADWLAATSGVDWSKSQIFIIDFQSLAIGRVRFGLDRDGEIVPVAEIHNDNLRVGPYWQMAGLPVYWSVTNSASAAETCRVLAVCATVKSEGGGKLYDLDGYARSASNGATTKTVSTTLIPLITIQVQTTFNSLANRGLVIPTELEISSDQSIHWQLLRNATVGGTSYAAANAAFSCVNVDTSGSAVSGGIVLASGFAGGGGTTRAQGVRSLTGRVPLAVNAAGTTGDTLTLAAIRIGTSNATVSGAISWKEIR